VQDTNDLAGALARVLTDSNGYYLIGCQPPRDAEDADALNVAVRLRRQDLRLRARRGPFRAMGLPGSQNAPTELLMSIAMSPVQKGGLPLQLTATPESADSASIMSRLLFDVSALTFRLNEAGRREAQIEIVELLIDERGAVAASASRRLELALDGAQHSRALTDGIVYTLPLKGPGPGRYVLRVAVRDLATGATGSASQTIEITAGPGKKPRDRNP
jgi:hypothetical protein